MNHLNNLDNWHVTVKDKLPEQATRMGYDIIITDYLSAYSKVIEPSLTQVSYSSEDVNYLIISADNNANRIREMISNGVSGYLTKDCSPEEISMALDTILNGGKFYCNKIIDLITAPASNEKDQHLGLLTEREKEVLVLISKGLTTAKISNELNISINTLNYHRKTLIRNLKFKSPAQLVAFALRIGLTN